YSAMKSARALGFATSCQLHHLLGRDRGEARVRKDWITGKLGSSAFFAENNRIEGSASVLKPESLTIPALYSAGAS
ncbi:hypothetical protein ACC783_33420, partial [Rhizobium ruizarguesonis]